MVNIGIVLVFAAFYLRDSSGARRGRLHVGDRRIKKRTIGDAGLNSFTSSHKINFGGWVCVKAREFLSFRIEVML